VVRKLEPPRRPLPRASYTWCWRPRPSAGRWLWCRVYHRSAHTPDGVTFRGFGPLARLDHHHAASPPTLDVTGRRILYVGATLATSASEVFGEAGVAAVCPRYRVSIVAPTRELTMYDLTARAAAMAIGALPALGDGSEARPLTQEWARAIHEDQPAGPDVCGVRYRTAYDSGYSVALWDCDDGVEIVRDARGRLQDLPLDDARVFGRLEEQMRERLIDVTTVSEAECSQCQKTT
jgi:RES domain